MYFLLCCLLSIISTSVTKEFWGTLRQEGYCLPCDACNGDCDPSCVQCRGNCKPCDPRCDSADPGCNECDKHSACIKGCTLGCPPCHPRPCDDCDNLCPEALPPPEVKCPDGKMPTFASDRSSCVPGSAHSDKTKTECEARNVGGSCEPAPTAPTKTSCCIPHFCPPGYSPKRDVRESSCLPWTETKPTTDCSYNGGICVDDPNANDPGQNGKSCCHN